MRSKVTTPRPPVTIELDGEAADALEEFIRYNHERATPFYKQSPRGKAIYVLGRQLMDRQQR